MSKHWCRPEPVVLAMFSCIGYYHYCYPKRKVLVPALGPSFVGRAVRAQSPFCKCMQHPELVVLAMFPCIRLLGTVTTFIQHRLPGAQSTAQSPFCKCMQHGSQLSWLGCLAGEGNTPHSLHMLAYKLASYADQRSVLLRNTHSLPMPAYVLASSADQWSALPRNTKAKKRLSWVGSWVWAEMEEDRQWQFLHIVSI